MHFRKFVPNPHRLDLRVCEAVGRSGNRTELSGFDTDNVIPQFQLKAVVLGDVRVYSKMFAEVQGVLVLTGNAQNRQHNALFFHAAVADADLLHKVYAGFFCHVNVVGVVYDVHAVCFMIKDHAGIWCNFHNRNFLSVIGGIMQCCLYGNHLNIALV